MKRLKPKFAKGGLVGGQDILDKDNSGDIDAKDFKLMREEKKVRKYGEGGPVKKGARKYPAPSEMLGADMKQFADEYNESPYEMEMSLLRERQANEYNKVLNQLLSQDIDPREAEYYAEMAAGFVKPTGEMDMEEFIDRYIGKSQEEPSMRQKIADYLRNM